MGELLSSNQPVGGGLQIRFKFVFEGNSLVTLLLQFSYLLPHNIQFLGLPCQLFILFVHLCF